MKIIKLILLFFLTPVSAHSVVVINSATQNISHGGTLTIVGTGFGAKSPAAPLMWDDGEDKTAGDAPDTSSANSYSQVAYSQYRCPVSCYESDTVSSTHQLRYRATPHTAVSTPVNAPHSNSTNFLAGGHEYTGNFGTRSVSVTVATPSAFTEKLYATWYYRVDPSWPSCSSGENHKISVVQAGEQEYSESPYADQYFYMDLQEKPCDDSGYNTVKMAPFTPTGGSCEDVDDSSPPWYYNPTACDTDGDIETPRDGWVRYEQRTENDTGSVHFLVDNENAWHGTNNPDFFTGGGSYDFGYAGMRSFTVGGYYRYSDSPSNRGHDNAFRYFDDIYVDSTLSRAVLANNATYASATIIEPQIPTAWSGVGGTDITATVNLGALTGNTAYLFVFDSDGAVNAVGEPVTIGNSGSMQSGTWSFQ